jgi:hypothetical protein
MLHRERKAMQDSKGIDALEEAKAKKEIPISTCQRHQKCNKVVGGEVVH